MIVLFYKKINTVFTVAASFLHSQQCTRVPISPCCSDLFLLWLILRYSLKKKCSLCLWSSIVPVLYIQLYYSFSSAFPLLSFLNPACDMFCFWNLYIHDFYHSGKFCYYLWLLVPSIHLFWDSDNIYIRSFHFMPRILIICHICHFLVSCSIFYIISSDSSSSSKALSLFVCDVLFDM